MKIGYVRVSTKDQNEARQDKIMEELGVEKVFMDKLSGKDTHRPQLEKMLSFVREGDQVVVSEIARFARSAKDLLELVEILQSKKVEFISKHEQFDTTTPAGKCMLTVFAAIAQMERENILLRQKEGIEIAKEQGKYKGRKPIEVDPAMWRRHYALWRSGQITATECMKRLNLKRTTFYKRVAEHEKSA